MLSQITISNTKVMELGSLIISEDKCGVHVYKRKCVQVGQLNTGILHHWWNEAENQIKLFSFELDNQHERIEQVQHVDRELYILSDQNGKWVTNWNNICYIDIIFPLMFMSYYLCVRQIMWRG